jgi:hypothetical protein
MKNKFTLMNKLLIATWLYAMWPMLNFGQVQLGQTIINAISSSFNDFGYAVSMPSTTTMAVGARNLGIVEVYEFNGTQWIQKGSTLSGVGAESFGQSVSMPSDNILAVGIPGNDLAANNAGMVNVYEWDGSNWVQLGNSITGVSANHACGSSVYMPSNNTIAISSPGYTFSSVNYGYVRVFEYDGSSWVQRGTFIQGQAHAAELKSVVMPDNNTVAFGTPGQNNSKGDAYVYFWNGTNWSIKGNGSDLTGDVFFDRFGTSVSMPNANTIVVSAPENDANATNSGQVKVFDWSGTTWVQRGVNIVGSSANKFLGNCVSMPTANIVAISAKDEVMVMEWNGTNWVQSGNSIQNLITSNGNGTCVFMPTSTVLATGNFGQFGETLNGNARVFDLCGDFVIDEHTACGSFTWIDGITYTESNSSAFVTLTNLAGCDSIVALNLTLLNNSGVDIRESCQPLLWIDGNTYTTSNNSATYTLTNIAGCDSLVTLNFNLITTVTTSVDYHEACQPFTWIDGNTYTSTNSTATFTLTNALGCDSIVTLDLYMYDVELTVANEENTLVLYLNYELGEFQWFDCDNGNTPIAGATNWSFTPTQSGNYGVEVYFMDCIYVSECTTVTIDETPTSITENLSAIIDIYPNPTSTTTSLSGVQSGQLIKVLDLSGKILLTELATADYLTLTTENWDNGVYFVQVMNDQVVVATKKLVVNK